MKALLSRLALFLTLALAPAAAMAEGAAGDWLGMIQPRPLGLICEPLPETGW